MKTNLDFDGPGTGFWVAFVAALVLNLAVLAVMGWAVISLVQWVTSK